MKPVLEILLSSVLFLTGRRECPRPLAHAYALDVLGRLQEPHLLGSALAHHSFYLDSDGWLCIEISRPFLFQLPSVREAFQGLKLCLGCRLRMLLAAILGIPNSPQAMLLVPLFSDPLSSAFSGMCQCQPLTGPKGCCSSRHHMQYTTSSRRELFLPARKRCSKHSATSTAGYGPVGRN